VYSLDFAFRVRRGKNIQPIGDIPDALDLRPEFTVFRPAPLSDAGLQGSDDLRPVISQRAQGI
jgi:hypothetical protein